MKRIMCFFVILVLCVTGCSGGPAQVFQGGKAAAKARLLRKTTTYYEHLDNGTAEGEDRPVTITTTNYNDKGLIDGMGTNRYLHPITYQYDDRGNPVSMTMEVEMKSATFPIENVYEGDTVKEVLIQAQTLVDSFNGDPYTMNVLQGMALTQMLNALERGVGYQDARISVAGTDVFLTRSGGETLSQCTMVPGQTMLTETEKNADGSSCKRVTYVNSEGTSTRTTTMDTMGRIIRMESDGSEKVFEFAYTETKDSESGHTIYQAESEHIVMRYEFDHGRMLTLEQESTGNFKEVTTYTDDGQILTYEMYNNGNLHQKDEYVYL